MAGGSGRQGATVPREEEGSGLDRDTGVRPLSTTCAAIHMQQSSKRGGNLKPLKVVWGQRDKLTNEYNDATKYVNS